MSEHLFRIVYCSQNTIGGAEQEQNSEISHILQTARLNNSRSNVTGALLYNSGYFAQVLEGPRTAVEKIFERIQRDERHGDVTVLESEDMESRDFPDWSMAHVAPATPRDSAEIGTELQQAMNDPDAAGHQVMELLRSLVVQED